jgi:hypothetical protein
MVTKKEPMIESDEIHKKEEEEKTMNKSKKKLLFSLKSIQT